MTEEEKEIIELIRNSENPQLALYKVLGIISAVAEEYDPAYYVGKT